MAGALIAPALGAIGGGGALGTALTAVGTAASVLGTISQSRAASAQSSQNAATAAFNAQVARNNAELARQQAQVQAQEIRKDTLRKIGTIRARQAAGGLVTTEGSPLLVQEEQALEGELEARRSLFEGNIEATNFLNLAATGSAQASASKQQSSSATTSGILGAAGTLAQGTQSLLR